MILEPAWISECILVYMRKKSKKAFFNLRRKQFLISWIISDLLCCGINLPNDTILLWIKKAMEVLRQWQAWKAVQTKEELKQELTSASKAFLRIDLRVKTCKVFLCFVAIVRVRVYYVDFFIFFLFLHHWWVLQVQHTKDDPFLMTALEAPSWCKVAFFLQGL